ncbi:FtsX-like permease family protein [Cellulomonas algicola]|uniref:FtsX-like permease family protein n=1 Tax=Cellulomonas algicola TaxID=2071633 RepID=UPI000F58C17F|nr:FtsX-like permease family protein [Cellulomonas algicola]
MLTTRSPEARLGWTLRVLRHRAAAQSTLLAAVLAVALVGATLLGTFALLLHTSETRALGEALGRSSATDTDIDVVLTLGRETPAEALPVADDYLDDLLGGVDADRERWLTSALYHVGTGNRIGLPMAYLASEPTIPEHATLVAGTWPDVAVDAEGRVPVAVPRTAADALGWTVGTVLPGRSSETRQDLPMVVVGVHELDGPGALWTRDLLDGAQFHPAWPIPGTFGFNTAPLYGPLVTVPEALAAGPVQVANVRVVAAPHLADAPTADVDALRTALTDGQATLSAAASPVSTGARLATFLPMTIDEAVAGLAVTRITLVVVGLLLVVLAVTVLLLAARLLAERRAAEQTLMASRGATAGQILRLATIEAAGVAAVTALAAPWLARLTYDAITRLDVLRAAGLHQDPGTPVSLWLTCAVAALLLAGVLLLPLLRRRGSVVEAEQQLVRQDRRGGLARSGADLAILVLAGLGIWQLQGYRSPVLAGTGPARIDPVLVTAPALLLLAGAVLTLRLLPLVAGLGERVASRSRSLVVPLGAWEVGRRPARASGAVLLLTLAVAVASFAQAFLGTWRTSQQEQADLATGTDLRLDRLPGAPLEQSTRVSALEGTTAVSAVTDRQVAVGGSIDTLSDARRPWAQLLAVDTTHADALLRGRIDGGWAEVTERLAPDEPATGVALPGQVRALLVDVGTDAKPSADVVASVTLVLQDALGVRTPLAVPVTPHVGEDVDDLRVELPEAIEGLSLVGLVVDLESGQDEDAPEDRASRVRGEASAMTVSLSDLRVVAPGADGSATGAVTPVALDSAAWDARPPVLGFPEPPGVAVVDGSLRLGVSMIPELLRAGGLTFAGATFEAPEAVPAVITDTLATATTAEVGDEVALDLGDGRALAVEVERIVPYLPGHPRGSALLVDRDVLSRATLLWGWADPMLDEWWFEVPDDRVADVAGEIVRTELGDPTTRVDARAVATDGPLRVGVQAALWVVTIAALALAFAGFAMSATVSVRTRRLELARLQALGAPRGGIVRAVLVEHGIIGVLGVAAGLAIGGLLAGVVGPLLTVSGQGRRPVPRPLVQWEWPAQAVLVAVLVALVALAVATTTNALVRRASGTLLRLGDER